MLTPFQRAHQSVTGLTEELFAATDYPCPVVTVAASAGRGVLVPGRYRLSNQDLREDIATYTGRLRSPRLAAATSVVASAAAAVSQIDLSVEGTAEQIQVAEYLRGLHVGFQLRHARVEEAGTVTACADSLWRPEQTTGDTTVALAVWELLPRVDGTLLPPTVTADVADLIDERLPRTALAAFQKLWRAALTGRPNRRSTPTILDWLGLATTWIDLHRQTFPDVALPNTDPVGGLLWPINPTGDRLGRTLAAGLIGAARSAEERADGLFADLDDTLPGMRVGSTNSAGTTGAGGALASGKRVVTWREPTEQDMKNRRVFTQGLIIAGHRSPSIALTPVAHPSGRLNPRQLVARSAQLAAGLPVTAKPWTAKRSVPRTSTKLRLAVIIDASATMQRWAQTAAPLGWAAAHASAELGGQHTLWGFGGEAFPIVAAGIAPAQVPVVLDPGSGSAGAGEAIRKAAAEIPGTGVGLVVVVTDGALPDGTDIEDAVDDAVAAGFTVVWAMPDSAAGRIQPRQATILDKQTPASIAATITETAFALLTGMNT